MVGREIFSMARFKSCGDKIIFILKVSFSTFLNCSQESGKDSQEKKKNHIKSLLVAATDCEPLYMIRLLQVMSYS